MRGAFSDTSCAASQTFLHEVSKSLPSPGDADLRRLRRLGRYLQGTQKPGIMVQKTNETENLEASTGADWSGGVLEVGSTTLREFTRVQSCQTLSSGESEYHAAVTTTAEAVLLQRLPAFLGVPSKLRLRIGSTAARGIIQRQGCSLLKHI